MADLIFTIKTPAELDGAQKAAAALEAAIGKAKGLGKEYAQLEKQLAATKASIDQYVTANGDAGKETEKAAAKTKLFVGQQGEVKKLLTELSHQFPLAGLAARAFINPISGALTAAVLVFVTLKRHIAELNANLDAMAANARAPLSNFAESFRQAQNEATASSGAFIARIDELSTAAGRVGEKTASAVAGIRALANAQLELNNAAQANAIARVNFREQLGPEKGGINAVEAIEQRRKINDFYAKQEEEARNRADAAELAARQRELADLKTARDSVAGAAPTGDPVRRQAEIKSKQDQAATAKKFADEFGDHETKDSPIWKAQDKLDSARDDLRKAKGSPAGARPSVYKAEAEAEAELDRLLRAKEAALKLSRSTDARVAELQNEQTAAETAKSKLSDLDEQIRRKEQELAELQRTQSLNQSVREQTGGMNKDTRAIEADTRIQEERERQEEERRRKLKQRGIESLDENRDQMQRESGSVRGGFGQAAPRAEPVPDVAGEFAAYHQENVAVIKSLIATVRDGQRELADISSRSGELRNT